MLLIVSLIHGVRANDAFEKILQTDEDLKIFIWENVHGVGRKPPFASMVAHYSSHYDIRNDQHK